MTEIKIRKHRCSDLYKIWQQQHREYFNHNNSIIKDKFPHAVSSFTSFLRINHLSLEDAKHIIWYDEKKQKIYSIIDNIIHVLFAIFGLSSFWQSVVTNANKHYTTISTLSIVSFVVGFCLFCWHIIRAFLPSVTQGVFYSQKTIIQCSLIALCNLHNVDTSANNKVVELGNGCFIEISHNDTELYSDSMLQSIYYTYAYKITITKNRPYYYILYTNHQYRTKTHAYIEFYKRCAEQIGKRWDDINREQITITLCDTIKPVTNLSEQNDSIKKNNRYPTNQAQTHPSYLTSWFQKRACFVLTCSQILSCILIFVFVLFAASFIYHAFTKSVWFVGGTLALASVLVILCAIFEFHDNKKRKQELQNTSDTNVHIGVVATATALVMMICTILSLIPSVPNIVQTIKEWMSAL